MPASVTKTKTKTKKTKAKTTMMMKTIKTTLFCLVFFSFFAGANAPDHNDDLFEAVKDSLNDLLQKLETIAGNVRPPLPTPLMGAAVLFVFCTTVPARLAAAWGYLARWAQSADSRALAHSRCRWILEGLSVVVVWVNGVLSPFKLDDCQNRARDAETALAATETALAHANGRTAAAQAGLHRVNGLLRKTKEILDHSRL